MKIFPSEYTVDSFRAALKINQAGKKSDQLELSMSSENIKIGQDYLNKLMYEFDDDGITDRQLEYKNTLEFVETRANILADQLKIIELNKQNFKEKNNITDISSNASNFVNQQFIYDAELFEAETQKELLGLLNKRIKDNPQKLLPTDIGIKSIEINNLLRDYNLLIKNREKYLLTVGQNNILIKNLNIQIDGYYNNILVSISNYSKSLDLSIKSLKEKENEFSVFNNEVPQNEKELRSIERELEIKEKLFLLLLQKKEEASINYAVVKPSIKIIDYARSESIPISPNKPYIFLICFSLGLTVPISIILLISFFDNKINTKDQLINKLNENLSVIGEIPHIPPNQSTNMLADNLSRTPLAESFEFC